MNIYCDTITKKNDTKAKVAPSPQEVRLTLLDTNSVLFSLRNN